MTAFKISDIIVHVWLVAAKYFVFYNSIDLIIKASVTHHLSSYQGFMDVDEAKSTRAEYGELMLTRFMEVLRRPKTYKTEQHCMFSSHIKAQAGLKKRRCHLSIRF